MRCEMESTVRPSEARRSASSTRASVSASRFAVISSSSSTAGFAGHRAGNGQQLPLPLRKHAVCADGIVPVRKRADGVIHSRQFRGILRHFLGDGRVGKRNLVKHRPRHAGEALLHAADARAALMVGNRRNVHAADGNIPFFRRIKPQQQPEPPCFCPRLFCQPA